MTADQYGTDDRTYTFNDSRSVPSTGWVKDGEILTGTTATTGTAGHAPLTATGAIRCVVGVSQNDQASVGAVAVYPDSVVSSANTGIDTRATRQLSRTGGGGLAE